MVAELVRDVAAEWLPIQVAALRLNLSVDAVRRRLKNGQLRGRRTQGVRGTRWEVQLGDPVSSGAARYENRGGRRALRAGATAKSARGRARPLAAAAVGTTSRRPDGVDD